MVLLPIAVPTQTGEVFVKVLALCKQSDLVSLPLRNTNKEFAVRILFIFPAGRIDVAVKSIRTQTGCEMLIEVVTQESRGIFLTEVRTLLVSERSLDVAVTLITGIQMVVQTFVSSAERNRFRPAVTCAVPCNGSFGFKRFLRSLLRDDVYHTAQGVGTVKYGSRSFDHFNALNRARIDKNRSAGHGFLFGNLLAVNKSQCSESIFTADGNAF